MIIGTTATPELLSGTDFHPVRRLHGQCGNQVAVSLDRRLRLLFSGVVDDGCIHPTDCRLHLAVGPC